MGKMLRMPVIYLNFACLQMDRISLFVALNSPPITAKSAIALFNGFPIKISSIKQSLNCL